MSNMLEAMDHKIEELTVVINDLKTISNTTFKLNDDQVVHTFLSDNIYYPTLTNVS